MSDHLVAASAAYVRDAGNAVQLLSVCHSVRSIGRTIHLHPSVLHAHWSLPAGMDTLRVLATEYRIVPCPIGPFLMHCLHRGACILDFLHPCSLFEDPEVASWVYMHLASMGPQLEVLSVLSYLSSTSSSHLHYKHLASMVLDALNDEEEGGVHTVQSLCSLAYRTLDDTQVAQLDLMTLGKHIMCARTATAALHLLGRVPRPKRAAVAKPLAWAALRGCARAVFYLQQLSHEIVHAPLVASAIAAYGYSPYIDRLGTAVLWHLVPYLSRHGAHTGLLRLAMVDGPRAVATGVCTGLITRSRPVPAIAHVADPRSVHEVVHFIFATRQLPPRLLSVDAATDNFQSATAMRLVSRGCQPLRQYMARLQRWRSRRYWLVEMLRGTSKCPLMAQLSKHTFAWRLIFAYI